MCNDITETSVLLIVKARQELFKITLSKINKNEKTVARWLSWLKRLTSNEEIPSSNLGRAFLFLAELFAKTHKSVLIKEILPKDDNGAK